MKKILANRVWYQHFRLNQNADLAFLEDPGQVILTIRQSVEKSTDVSRHLANKKDFNFPNRK